MMTSPTVNASCSSVAARPSVDARGSTIKLLMLAYNFPPAATAGVHRTLRFTKYLRQFGCHPTVLTRHCQPDSGGEQLLAQVPDDVVVYRTGKANEPADPLLSSNRRATTAGASAATDSLRRQSPRSRIVQTAKCILRPGWELLTETPDQFVAWSRQAAVRGLEICRVGSFDAIYTTGPPHSTHLAGLKIRRKTGLPWIADLRDPWARRTWIKARNPWGQRLLPYFESKVVNAASIVILNNDASADDFRRVYRRLPAEKFVSLPNGYDPHLLPIAEQLRQRRAREAEPAGTETPVPVICHPGSLYGERDPRPILKAIEHLHHNGIDVLFQQIGYATPLFDPAGIAQELGIGHLVQCIPPVSHSHVMQYMSRADILLIIQPNTPLQVPGKLYEMLLFDQPILAVCDSLATDAVIASAGDAWSVKSRDVDGIADALKKMIGHKDSAVAGKRQLARAGFNGCDLASELSDIIASQVTKSRPPF